ncbi:MAG TPA: 2-oxoacid:acceptor oxidoreductase family protein [Rectinemataceae bacterium]|nr:2-oxoacid:acceptor oxidoreductase family protein [Rectinemataceae bacterium]
MIEKTFMAGFGGQGIISMGQAWIYAAMKEGLEVTFFPFYGAEKRGGVARASVIVSDTQIASPLVTKAHSVVVMSADSLAIGEAVAAPKSLLLVNSDLVKTESARKDLRVLRIPCNSLAEEIGDVKIANMVMMGALAEATGALKLATIEKVFESFFPPSKRSFIPMNLKAIEAGRLAARKA